MRLTVFKNGGVSKLPFLSSCRLGPPQGSKRTIRLDIQYEGTKYVGWQRQACGISVQEVLDTALSKIANEKITLFASSRTDAGVHARQQVVSFSLKKSCAPIHAFVRGTNTLLPKDIRVISGSEEHLWFHANQYATRKTYRYYIQQQLTDQVFYRLYSWCILRELNIDLMQEGAHYLIGQHDFSGFRSHKPITKTSVRTIYKANWQLDHHGLIFFEIEADGFLRHMVRNIIGLLVEIGLGKNNPEDVKKMLMSTKREPGAKTAPPHGLFLWSVMY